MDSSKIAKRLTIVWIVSVCICNAITTVCNEHFAVAAYWIHIFYCGVILVYLLPIAVLIYHHASLAKMKRLKVATVIAICLLVYWIFCAVIMWASQ